MNNLVNTLNTQIAENATELHVQELYLQETKEQIKNNMNVVNAPSVIIARIEYLKGRHMGLMSALYLIQDEANVGA
jgi:hypothetical protein